MGRPKIKKVQRGNKNTELPSEIINTHILPRLPIKSILRFRCACKSWNQLTHSPAFARLHKMFHAHTQILITPWTNALDMSTLYIISAPFHEDGTLGSPCHLLTLATTHFYRRQIVNGLLCFDSSQILYPYFVNRPVFIFNPGTREILTLPTNDNFAQNIPFSHVYYYLGFTHTTDEYKVLGIRGFGSILFGSIFECKVFTLGSSQWRDIDSTMPFNRNEFPYQTDPVCANGTLHWMLLSRKSIAAFDVGDECFREISMPDEYYIHGYGNLIVVDGKLAVVYANFHVNLIVLWILEDCQNQVWVQKNISLPIDLIGSNLFVPVGTIHTGELLLTPFSPVTPTSVLFYDMKRRSFRNVEIAGLPEQIFPTEYWKDGGSSLFCYEETIMSLRSEDRTQLLN